MRASSTLLNIGLKRLSFVRLLFLSSLILAFALAWKAQWAIAWPPLIALTVGLTLILIIGVMSSRKGVSANLLWANLWMDVLGVSTLLYFSGGANNPFISYLLVPVTIAAATLPAKYAIALTIGAISLYTLLLFFFQPLAAFTPHSGHGMGAHITGMWATFVVSALLITYFVLRMARSLREQEEAVRSANEDNLRDEQLLAVAALAAGTAHELGTPLSTATVLADAMGIDDSQAQRAKDLALLRAQLSQCQTTLTDLITTARNNWEGETPILTVSAYIDSVLQKWALLRPQDVAELILDESLDRSLKLKVDATLAQSLINLLDNAADVHDQHLVLRISQTSKKLIIAIEDDGPGLDSNTHREMSMAFTTTKEHGSGLGTFISNATASRYGGDVLARRRDLGGTVVEMRLPLEKICP